MSELLNEFLSGSAAWGVLLTLAAFALGTLINRVTGKAFCNPLLLGAIFVFTAGMFYRHMGGRRGALIGSLAGAAMMAVLSVFTNYFVVYPIYTAFMPMDAILGMYQAINPNVKNLWDALIWFNMPFTFIKGLISVVITFLIYKKISPLLKGRKKDSQ